MEEIIPVQHTGRAIDAKSSKEFLDGSPAARFFEIVKQRLAEVNSWQALAGEALSKFTLVNSQAENVNRSPIKGDYFKIDIPGPGSIEGEGYDWVHVEDIFSKSNEDSEYYGFTVRPCSNPNKSQKETAHFYSDESTSTFVVRREGAIVSAEIHDRNVSPNNDAERTTDKIRHSIVGVVGSLTLSKMQWQSLTAGLLSNDDL